ncbi:MAG TPA: hypothetical protein VE130_06680 [Nitrososphaeraceae archaeon]|nr:hypothetical protein [Nitrososphaeraceae archaeon]
MEKVCALNAILVSQIPLKVRNKEQESNRAEYTSGVWGSIF